jgi:glycerophosphoryl diester phosphodiesterase
MTSSALNTRSGFMPLSRLLNPSNPRVLVAAHRGAWHRAPENSLAAIDDAIGLGVDIVECDVRATRDGVLVLMHDDTADRMTTARGAIAGLDWAELGASWLRDGAGGAEAAITGERPATLADALVRARDRVILNIDTKVEALAGQVAEAVIDAGMADQVFVKAFVDTEEDIEAARSSPFFGRVPFVPMLRPPSGQLTAELRRLAPLRCPMAEVAFTALEELETARAELARLQARLWVNTIQVSHSLDLNDARALADPDAVWGRLLSAGAGAIQTDEAGALVAYLEARGRR